MTKSKPRSERRVVGSAASPMDLYSPWLDLIVGCGAWSAPLLLISYFSIASSTRAWSVAFYALALFFNYPHYMATIYRAYHRAEDFQKYRIFTVHITALIRADAGPVALLASHSSVDFHDLSDLEPVALQRTELRSVHDVRPPRGSETSARPSGARSTAPSSLRTWFCFLGFHTGTSSDPLFISLGIPASREPIGSRSCWAWCLSALCGVMDCRDWCERPDGASCCLP